MGAAEGDGPCARSREPVEKCCPLWWGQWGPVQHWPQLSWVCPVASLPSLLGLTSTSRDVSSFNNVLEGNCPDHTGRHSSWKYLSSIASRRADPRLFPSLPCTSTIVLQVKPHQTGLGTKSGTMLNGANPDELSQQPEFACTLYLYYLLIQMLSLIC